jgi:hypothetical protein
MVKAALRFAMQLARPPIASDPLQFGRAFRHEPTPASAHSQLGDDIKLFVVTFLAGFVFVSVFLA